MNGNLSGTGQRLPACPCLGVKAGSPLGLPWEEAMTGMGSNSSSLLVSALGAGSKPEIRRSEESAEEEARERRKGEE